MPNPPPEIVPPDPVEITQSQQQIDSYDVEPNPATPKPVAPKDLEPVVPMDYDDISPENQPLEERDA